MRCTQGRSPSWHHDEDEIKIGGRDRELRHAEKVHEKELSARRRLFGFELLNVHVRSVSCEIRSIRTTQHET